MNTKRNILKFAIIVLVVIVLSIVVNIGLKSIKSISDDDLTGGITVISEDGKEIARYGIWGTYIEIKEDNVTITGTAENDTMIALEGDAANVTIENLNQDVFGIDIYMSEKLDGKITFKGINEVQEIYSFQDLDIEAEGISDELTVTKCIDIDGISGSVSGGTIRSGYISAFGDLKIIGETVIYLKEIQEFRLEKMMAARLEAYETLFVDLSGAGKIEVSGSAKYNVPVSAMEAIEFGNGTVISEPESGSIMFKDAGYGKEYIICNSAGSVPEHIVIKSVE